MPKNITSYLNENINLVLCIFLIVISMYFLLFRKLKKKREGFDINDGINDIKNAFNSVKDLATKIPNEITSIGSKINDIGSSITDGINKSTSAIKSGVTSGISDIKNTATNVTNQIDNINSKLNNVGSTITDGINMSTNTIKTGVTSGINDIERTAKNVTSEINNLGSKIKDVGNTINDGINTSANVIKSGVTSGVNDIKNTAENITSEIDSKLKDFLKQVEDITKNVVLAKIMSFFNQIKYILDKAIVQPFKTLFFGIGTVFTAIFDIIKMVGDKIVGLPGCMPYYMTDGFLNGISGGLRYFLPKFIMSILSFIYNWTLNPILRWTGVSKSIDKCKSFNVNDKVEKMDNAFKDIANTFRKDFGQIPPLTL